MKNYTLKQLGDELYRLKYLLKNYKMTEDERDYISILAIGIVKRIEKIRGYDDEIY